ncbi:hypothetical protein C8R42DRAFT_718904 [Lentinula raphanica]|nr:hypothetical protein C8R42DRAFT_718904 [Lentinula raphanica]
MSKPPPSNLLPSSLPRPSLPPILADFALFSSSTAFSHLSSPFDGGLCRRSLKKSVSMKLKGKRRSSVTFTPPPPPAFTLSSHPPSPYSPPTPVGLTITLRVRFESQNPR